MYISICMFRVVYELWLKGNIADAALGCKEHFH